MIDMPKIKAKRRSKKRVPHQKQLKVIVQFDDHFFPQIVHKIRQANFRRDYVVPYGQTKKEDPLKRLKREYDEMLLHSGVDLNDEVTTRLQSSTDVVNKLGQSLDEATTRLQTSTADVNKLGQSLDEATTKLQTTTDDVNKFRDTLDDDVTKWLSALTDTLNRNQMETTGTLTRVLGKFG